MTLRLLHTADWHLGRQLFGRRRDEEFRAFLDWMLDVLSTECIDVLLIAGDVFDTAAPSNRAQQQYYNFLTAAARTLCRHIVIIGGNHDSATFLEAPQALLATLNIHVVGQASANLVDEVITLKNADGQPELIVCAVPYLRDRDIRSIEPGETVHDKARKLVEGIAAHYAQITALGEELAQKYHVPLIATGHLFAAGGRTTADDGVRDLYVGSLGHVSANIFPAALQYVALGHLHVPQIVGGQERIRYSGSPIAMGFAEAGQAKQVLIIDISTDSLDIKPHCIPTFQPLVRIHGDLAALTTQLTALKPQDIWIEAEYTGDAIIPNLRQTLETLVDDGACSLLAIKNRAITQQTLAQSEHIETIAELSPETVFTRLLDSRAVPAEQHTELLAAYYEILRALDEN